MKVRKLHLNSSTTVVQYPAFNRSIIANCPKIFIYFLDKTRIKQFPRKYKTSLSSCHVDASRACLKGLLVVTWFKYCKYQTDMQYYGIVPSYYWCVIQKGSFPAHQVIKTIILFGNPFYTHPTSFQQFSIQLP